MKKIYGLLFALCLLFLSACSSPKISEKSFVTITVKEDTLTPTGATLLISNNSKDLYYYGESYHLQEHTDNAWRDREPIEELAFIQIAYELSPGSEESRELSWDIGYGELPSGTYRVVKIFTNDATGKSEDVFGEFKIK